MANILREVSREIPKRLSPDEFVEDFLKQPKEKKCCKVALSLFQFNKLLFSS